MGGDIHCGVTSDIHDEETELSIRHVTTSPVTNHVCKVGHSSREHHSGQMCKYDLSVRISHEDFTITRLICVINVKALVGPGPNQGKALVGAFSVIVQLQYVQFFPERSGLISERYRYDHLPLGPRDRNYAEIVVSLEPDTRVTVDLVRVKTNMFEITNYMSEDEED